MVQHLLTGAAKAEAVRFFSLAESRYCLAAMLGSVEAYFRLGRMHVVAAGRGGDLATGRSLLSVAAQRGHLGAVELLGMYPVGEERYPECFQEEFDALRVAVDSRLPRDEFRRFLDRLPPDKKRLARMIERQSIRVGIDPLLALAVVRVESNFDVRAQSAKNAQGLMQLIPATATRFKVGDPFDPEHNVRGGLRYLRWLLDRFDGDVMLTAAAYNAGEGAVKRHGGIPPYAETQAYVRRVVAFYGDVRHGPQRP